MLWFILYYFDFTHIIFSHFSASNECGRRNGDCSHFCFSVPQIPVSSLRPDNLQRLCGCPDGMVIDSNDQRTCVDDPESTIEPHQCPGRLFTCANDRLVNLFHIFKNMNFLF